MACSCRALRALALARAPFPRPALLAPSYRAFSTGPSDTLDPPSGAPSHQASKPTREPAASTPSTFHDTPKEPSDTPKEAFSDTPGQTHDPHDLPDAARHRRRRTIAPKNPPPRDSKPQAWQTQKDALQRKFPLGWAPPKKLSPDALSGLRALHAQFPETYTTPVLSDLFQVSPEAVRRILKNKWSPSTAEEEEDRRKRWVKRGEKIWQRWADLGVKVPRGWRPEGVSKWGRKVQSPEDTEGAEGLEKPEVLVGSRTHKKSVNWGSRARRNVTKKIM